MTPEETLVLLELAEPEDHFAPKDSAGNLDPLETAATETRPTVTSAFTGLGRLFDGTAGLQAEDAADGDTLTTRDATVQAIVSFDDLAGAFPRALYVRGAASGGAAQYYSLGLEVAKLAAPANPVHLELRLFWMDSTGAIKTQVGGTFIVTAEDQFVLLTATRRWDASDSVTCRYYVNDKLIGEVTSTNGDIAGATTGTTRIGCRGIAGPNHDRFWKGVIDQLKVTDYEMPHSEIEATFLRITRYADIGEQLYATRVPPGSNWAAPGTYWSKLGRLIGGVMGFAFAKIEELRENAFPERAYSDILTRWERKNRIAPKHREPLDTRRARVMAVEGRENGYSVEKVQDVLAEPLAMDAADIEILEPTNTLEDTFTRADGAIGADDECWYVERADAVNMDWDIETNALKGSALAAAPGARWDGSTFEPHRILTSIAHATGVIVETTITQNLDTQDGVTVGLHLTNWANRDALWFGRKNVGGVIKLGYVKYLAGVLSAFVVLEDPAPAVPNYLRIRRSEATPSTYALERSTDGVNYTAVNVTLTDFEPTFAGFAFHSTGDITALVSAKFDNFKLITPQGDRPFHWYAYRDPAEPGVAELGIANAVARRVTPAHVHGAAVTSKSVICDDPIDGLCDRGPMGWPT